MTLHSPSTRRWSGRCLAWAGACLLLAAPAGALARSASAQVAPAPSSGDTPYDPWLAVNRPLFGVSMELDKLVIGPIAHAYKRIAPAPIRDRIGAALDNLREPGTALNDVAQGHPKRAGKATARFAINSTVGLLGLFDVASGMKIAPHDSDFGQTLGRYGAQPGPYIYVPILGPSNLRDGVGRIVDTLTDPVSLFIGGITTTGGAIRYSAVTVDTRLYVDGAFKALKDSTDPYATTRSAYTQRRASIVRAATGEAEVLPDFDAVPGSPSPRSPSEPN